MTSRVTGSHELGCWEELGDAAINEVLGGGAGRAHGERCVYKSGEQGRCWLRQRGKSWAETERDDGGKGSPKAPSSGPAIAWDPLPMKPERTPTCRQMGAELLWLKPWGVQGLGLCPPGPPSPPSKECHHSPGALQTWACRGLWGTLRVQMGRALKGLA